MVNMRGYAFWLRLPGRHHGCAVPRAAPVQYGAIHTPRHDDAIRTFASCHALLSGKVPKKTSILFFGSDDFAIATLKRLHESRSSRDALSSSSPSSLPNRVIDHIEVVCPVDKPAGRGKELRPVPMKVYAQSQGIKVHDAPATKGVAGFEGWALPKPHCADGGLSKDKFDFGIVVSFGRLLPAWVIDAFNIGAINLHPSLLPRYRGAAPLHRVIMNGDALSGVSVIRLAKNEFDSGRILLQKRHVVRPDADFDALHDELANVGATSMYHAIQHFESVWPNAWAQAETHVTHAPKVTREDGYVTDWASESVYSVYRKFLALGDSLRSHASEGIHTGFEGNTIRLFDLRPDATEMNAVRAIHRTRLEQDPAFIALCADEGLTATECLDRHAPLHVALSAQAAVADAPSDTQPTSSSPPTAVPGDVFF
eukprot:Opistho-2@58378